MRVGAGAGPFYVSGHVNDSSVLGCLAWFAGSLMAIPVTMMIVTGVQHHSAGPIIGGVAGLLFVLMLGILIAKYRRDGRRRDMVLYAGQDCRYGGL